MCKLNCINKGRFGRCCFGHKFRPRSFGVIQIILLKKSKMATDEFVPKVFNFIDGELCEAKLYENSIDPSNLKVIAQSTEIFIL